MRTDASFICIGKAVIINMMSTFEYRMTRTSEYIVSALAPDTLNHFNIPMNLYRQKP